MWRGWWEFVIDIVKKMIVTVVTAPILAVAIVVYANSISVAISSFRLDFYATYWYLVVSSLLLSVLFAYVLYKRRAFFPILVPFTLVLTAIFSSYRLHLLPTGFMDFPI